MDVLSVSILEVVMHRYLLLLGLAALPSVAGAQDMPESSPMALTHYAQGVEFYVKGNNAQAIEHFTQAYATDRTFYVALFLAATAHSNAGRGAVADSLYAIVAQHRDRLSPYFRNRLDSQMAGRAGDMPRAIDIARRTAREAPGTKATYNLALLLAPRNRPGEARELLRTLDPTQEPMRGWYSYFSVYGQSAHALGDYDDELRSARQGRTLFPDDIRTADDEAIALASLGRFAELNQVLDQVAALPTSGAMDPGLDMVSVGLEAIAHGYAADGKRYLERAVGWYAARPADQQAGQNARANRAYALYTLARYREARVLYDGLASEFPANGAYLAWTGILAGLTGDRARAQEVARRIESGEPATMTAVNRFIWRGLIAAALGERDQAIALLRESGVRPRWMHRDPLLRATILTRPEFVAYLKPES